MSQDTDKDPVRVGKEFHLGRVLGEGGMGVVYEGFESGLGQHAAVKVLRQELAGNEEMVDRFNDEASIMASIEHPGSLPVYGRGEDSRRGSFYAMKKVGGRCLTDLLEERGEETSSSMWRRRFLNIFSDVCATMAYAHENGIVHRDLKPDNVMIDEHGSVFVIDWGIAKRMERDDKNRQLPTMSGVVMGTPGYMAPEQAEGNADGVDPSADVFALGVMLYEILTGVVPFAGKNEREALLHTVYREVEDPRRKNPFLSRHIVAVCLKALSKHPTHRYRTAKELYEDIQAFQEGRPVSVVKPRLPEKVIYWTRRWPVRAAATWALCFVVFTVMALVGVQIWIDHRLADKARDGLAAIDLNLEELRGEIAAMSARAMAAEGDEKVRLEKEAEILKTRFFVAEIRAVNLLRDVSRLRFIRADNEIIEDAKARIFDTIDTGQAGQASLFSHAVAESILEQIEEGRTEIPFRRDEIERLREVIRQADEAAGLSPN